MRKTRRKCMARSPCRGIVTVILVLAAIWACGVGAWRVPIVRAPAGLAAGWPVDGSSDVHIAQSDALSDGGLSLVVRVRNPLAATLAGHIMAAPQSLYVRMVTDKSLRLQSAEPAVGVLPCLLAARDARAWIGRTLAEIGQSDVQAAPSNLDMRQSVQKALSSAAHTLVLGNVAAVVPGVGSTCRPFEVLDSAGTWVTETNARPRGLLLLEVGPYCGQCLDALETVVSLLVREGSSYPKLVLLVRGRASDLGPVEARVRGVRSACVLDPEGILARSLLGSDTAASCVLMDGAGGVRFSGTVIERSNALLEALNVLKSGTG